MTRPMQEFQLVRALISEGRNDCEISRVTNIPRETVRDWRWGIRDGTARPLRKGDYACHQNHDFRCLPPEAYSYVLGMYLGDGYIAKHPRGVWRLRIVADTRYPGIIEECSHAMETLMAGKRAHRLLRSGCIEISMSSKHWPCLFPQHGPGRKHERPIRLVSWQEEFVNQATESFVRGLMHSDGCRVVANDRGVKSVRYHFSNRSDDIKELLCESLDRLDIPWTQPSDRDIAIYRKAATARLDQFVGPKK